MTLLEIMIVLGVLALLIAVFAARLTDKQTVLRHEAGKLSGALRLAFDKAMVTAKPHRVVFDLEEDAYMIQACEGKVKLKRTSQKQLADDEEAARKAEEEQKKAAELSMIPGQAAPDQATAEAIAKARAAMGGVAGQRAFQCGPLLLPNGKPSPLGKPVKLPGRGGLRISKIHVSHIDEVVEEGQVTVTFFPLGYAERAVIELRNDDDDVYTILVHPITGRVEIKQGEWEREAEEFVGEDSEGEEVVQ